MIGAKIKPAEQIQDTQNIRCPERIMELKPGITLGMKLIAIGLEKAAGQPLSRLPDYLFVSPGTRLNKRPENNSGYSD